jgi:hypothetical protein
MMISAISPYSTYNKYTQSFGMRKGKNMYYQQVSKDFNPKEVSDKLTQKYLGYPLVIKGIVQLIPEYLSGRIDAKNFSKLFLDRTPDLLTRIGMASDGKEFKNAYERDISLIKSLDHFCYEFNEGDLKKEDFDNFTEIHAKSLLKA